jgi:hypothetical protein
MNVRIDVTLTEQQARMVLRSAPWSTPNGVRHSVPLEQAEAVLKTAIRDALEQARGS